MKFASLIFFLFLFVAANVSLAANNNALSKHLLAIDTLIKRDTLPKVKPQTGKKKQPTKGGKPVSAAKDTSSKAKGGLQSVVKWNAEDSTYTDNEKEIMYLYGKARVTYEDFELDADYIQINKRTNQIFAKGRIDPRTHRYVGRPITKQKNDKPAAADSIYYNYVTKKGKVFNPASEQGGNFVSGGLAKKLNENEVAYHNVLYSTCDLPYPDTHFGIVITKGIAEKNQIISGPAYLEIAGVPLPLAIPFGFFPKPNSRSSGFILPSFGEDARLGFFLREFGYYVALNDNVDFTNTATVYSKGAYELSTTSRYLKRYSYQGSLALRYSSHNYGNEGDPSTKDFNILWSHAQDPNAHPGSVFSASVNAGTHSYYANSPGTQNSLQQLTQNTLRSSISYQRNWAGTPFNLTVNLSHSQDLAAKTVDLELPSFTFNMASVSPFDSKDRVGEQKWYQKISLSYNSHGTNRVTAIPEDQLFQGNTLAKRLQSGFQQTIPINLNLTFLRFFQFSTNATYNEYWNFQTINQRYDRNSLTGQTNSGGTLVIDTVPGFKRAGEYTLGASLSTKLYGIKYFKGGRLKALRHVMTPSISLNYHPDFGDPSYGYYQNAVTQSTVPYPYQVTNYSIFQSSAVGGPSRGRQAGIGFTLDNTIDAKLRAKSTDTSQTDRKIQLLQGLSFSSFYNFAVDSFRLSPISFSGHTAIFNQKLNINFGGVFDPYVVKIIDSISNNALSRTPVRIDRYTWQDGHLPRLSSFYASTDISLNSNSKANPNRQNTQNNINQNRLQGLTPDQAERLALVSQDQSAFVDFTVPWNINLSYSFNYTNDGLRTSVQNTVQARGDLNISPKWKVTYYSDIDLRKQKVSTAQLGIYRDLHCWDLAVQWIPFGYLKMYSVMLRVKASILQDLKLSKRSDYTNNQYYNPYY